MSLGVIALSAIRLHRNRQRAVERGAALALGVRLAGYLAAAALYVVTPSVAVFGSLSIVVAFLLYDLFDLGPLGTRLFLAVFDMVAFALLTLYPLSFPAPGAWAFPGLDSAARDTGALRLVLLLGGLVFVASYALEAVAGRVRVAEGGAA